MRKELRVARALDDHPNILRPILAFEEGPALFLVQARAQQSTCARRRTRRGRRHLPTFRAIVHITTHASHPPSSSAPTSVKLRVLLRAAGIRGPG